MGIPESVWGSPYQNGDARGKNPHIGLGIPESVRGSPNQNGDPRISIPKRGSPNQYGDENPNRFGDPHTKTGIPESPYQNGDPRTNMGIVQSLTHTNMGFIPIWDLRVSSPNWNGTQNGDPILVWGSPYRYGQGYVNIPNRGVPILIWGSFQFGDQHMYL